MVSPAYRETQQAIERVFEKQIFFVVGWLKSGTTWVQFLLDAHSEICCRGEGHFTDVLYPKLAKTFTAYNTFSSDQNRLFEAGGIEGSCPVYDRAGVDHVFATAMGFALARWVNNADVACIGDKTPEHDEALDFLASIIPGSKFIHIVRDGRDAAVSTWTLNIHRDRERQLEKFSDFNIFVKDFAKGWCRRVRRTQTFGAANPERYFELRYEDLHREPEPIVRGLFEFLGVDAGDDVVVESIRAASFERLTSGRKKGEEQPGAHMRKGVIGDWRNHFDEADRATFHEQAGDLLKELGYDD